MNPTTELAQVIDTLAALRPRVDQTNDITLPVINCINRLVAVRKVLVSQQEEKEEQEEMKDADAHDQ